MKVSMKMAGLGLLMAALALPVFAGGGQQKKAAGLERIKQKGTLILATESTYPPFQYLIVENGKTINAGLDVDLARLFAQSIGVELMVNEMAFDSIIPAIQAGTADISASFNPTPERAQVIDFSPLYYRSEQRFVVRKGEGGSYPNKEAFKGHRLGAQKGTVQENIISDELGMSNGLALPKVTALIQELANKNIDGIVMDFSVADTYVAAYPDLVEQAPFVIKDNRGIAMVIAQNQKDLLAELDRFVTAREKDGTIERLYQKNIKGAIDQILEAQEE
jgi:polar amino acid transport system substrate-binding protein